MCVRRSLDFVGEFATRRFLLACPSNWRMPIANLRLPIANCRLPISLPNLQLQTLSTSDYSCQSTIGNWKSAMLSFVSQRHKWIHFRCPPCRDVRSGEGDETQHQRHAQERHGVGRSHAVEERCYRARCNGSKQQPQRESRSDDKQPIPQHEPEDILFLCAERHPYADLTRTLCHRIRNNAVNSGSGK